MLPTTDTVSKSNYFPRETPLSDQIQTEWIAQEILTSSISVDSFWSCQDHCFQRFHLLLSWVVILFSDMPCLKLTNDLTMPAVRNLQNQWHFRSDISRLCTLFHFLLPQVIFQYLQSPFNLILIKDHVGNMVLFLIKTAN